MAEVLVLGAGMVGIGAALALQARGHEVRVIDRRAPGQETSFGNAGVIQAEAQAPYAMPRALSKLMQYGLGLSNDLMLNTGALPRLAPVLAAYFNNSAPQRHAAITAFYAPLIAQATQDHDALISAAGADHLVRRTGLGEVFEAPDQLATRVAEAERTAAEFGLGMTALDGTDLQAQEPLFHRPPAGAVIWKDSWSARDPGALVQAYAGLFERRGGEIIQAGVTGLAPKGEGWRVSTTAEQAAAEHVVVALGPWTPAILKPLGYRMAMLPKRGYHGHFETEHELSRPYLMADHGVVLSSMDAGLRMTTGAHLTQMDGPKNLKQLTTGLQSARVHLDIGDPTADAIWHGTRPCLPDMLPMVGKARSHTNLWVNFGHGHQGFTLGPTTGNLLAEIMDGRDDTLTRAYGMERRIWT